MSGAGGGGPTNVIGGDPKDKDILYCGTDLGVFVTTSSEHPSISALRTGYFHFALTQRKKMLDIVVFNYLYI